MENDVIICHCYDVYKSEIVKAIKTKELTSIQEVIDVTDAGAGCGSCHNTIQEILDEVNGKM
jgi:NifU-like protein